jgi:hypothetical protein
MAETSSDLVEQAVRRKLDIPRGKLGPYDFAKIDELDLFGTPISSLTNIATLPRLSSLNLANCTSLSDLAPLARLEGLRFLNLEGCSRVADLAPLARLSKLVGLKLQDCVLIKDLDDRFHETTQFGPRF